MFLQLCERWNNFNGNNGKKIDGHISNEDYLTYKKLWDRFNMKNMGDYHDLFLKKMFCY